MQRVLLFDFLLFAEHVLRRIPWPVVSVYGFAAFSLVRVVVIVVRIPSVVVLGWLVRLTVGAVVPLERTELLISVVLVIVFVRIILLSFRLSFFFLLFLFLGLFLALER